MKRFSLHTLAMLTWALPVWVGASLPVYFMDPVINRVPNLTLAVPMADDINDSRWLMQQAWEPVRFDLATALDAQPPKAVLTAAASKSSPQPWPQTEDRADRMKSAVLTDSRIRPQGMARVVHRKNRDNQRGSKRLCHWRPLVPTSTWMTV